MSTYWLPYAKSIEEPIYALIHLITLYNTIIIVTAVMVK